MRKFVGTLLIATALFMGLHPGQPSTDSAPATPTPAVQVSSNKPVVRKDAPTAPPEEPPALPPIKERRSKPERGVTSWLQGDDEYDHALDLSKKLHQPVLIDFSPTWCGPCQMLARNFFSRTDVMQRIDAKYIPLRTGEGSLSRKFKIRRYPTIAVVNLDGTYRTFFPTEGNFFDELEGATK